MPSKHYPFIDVAVLEQVRSRFAAGEALVLFSDDMDKVLWANGAGANLFNHEFIYDFLDAGLPSSDVTTRQIKATTGQLANPGDKRSFLMRMTTNFQRVTIQATVEMIPDRTGDRVVLFSAPVNEKPLPLAERAKLMLSGFDDPDTHMAVLGVDGEVLAASDGFANLGMTPDTARALVSAVSRDADQLLKRPVPTGRGYLPAAIGQLSQEPSLNLLFCVETAIGQMDPTNDDTFMPVQAPAFASETNIETAENEAVSGVSVATLPAVDFDDALDAVAHIEDNSEEPVEAEDIVEARANVSFDMPVKDDLSMASMLKLLDGASDDDLSLSYADEVSNDMADLSAMNRSDAFLNPTAFSPQDVDASASADQTSSSETAAVDDQGQTDPASADALSEASALVSGETLPDLENSEEAAVVLPVDQQIADDRYWAPVPEIDESQHSDALSHADNFTSVPDVDASVAVPEIAESADEAAAALETISDSPDLYDAVDAPSYREQDDVVSEETGHDEVTGDAPDMPDNSQDISETEVESELIPETTSMDGVVETASFDDLATSGPVVVAVTNAVADVNHLPVAAEGTPNTEEASFVYQRNARPVRFVWKVDAQGKFSEISEEFAQAVGPNAAAINDMQFSDVAAAFKMDPEGKIGELLQKRDTWSGKTIFWPIENTSLRVPVDLAALPTYSRSRSFDGFRGFGIVRLADAVEDPDQIGLSLGKPSGRVIEEIPETDPVAETTENTSEIEVSGDAGMLAAIDDQAVEANVSVESVRAVEEGSVENTFVADAADGAIETQVENVPADDAVVSGSFETVSELADEYVAPSDDTALTDFVTGESEITDIVSDASQTDAGLEQNQTDSGEHADATQREVPGMEIDAPSEEEIVSTNVEQLTDDKSEYDLSGADDETTSRDPAGLIAETSPVVPNDDDDFRGERPALRLVDNPGRRHSDKVVNLEAHRGKSREGLSLSEQAAFNEIARQLDPFGKRILNDTPKLEAPETDPRLPVATDDQVASELPADASSEANSKSAPANLVASEEPVAFAATPNISALIPSRTSSDEQLTEKFVDALPLAILVHTGEKLIHGNPEFFRLTGYESLKQLQDYGGIDALLEQDQSPRDGDEAPGMMLVTEAGTLEPVTARLQSVRWDDSNALLLALVPQRSEVVRKQAAAAMADATQSPQDQIKALTIEVDELRSILETATDGVVIVGQDGEIRSMNKSASALFNFDDEDTRGKSFAMLFAHESQKAVMDYLSGLAGHGVASVLNDGREVIGREASGGFIPLFMTMGRLSSSNGYCAVIRDITQWKRTEEELRTAKRAAETANAHKSEFLARVSHEIRTPLNAIIGFSDMMATERLGPIGHPRYVEYSDDIGRSGRHVLDIVNDLLDISKIEAGEMELDFTSVELNEAISEAVSLVQPQVNSQRVIIRTSLSQSVPNIVADQRSIKQIAINILANAIRYTPAGGQIVVSTAYEPNGSVVLRIRDTGVGMTRAELEQALKPFRQVTTGSRKRGDGTGLGLPLTKAMVDANRANFAISSTPNEGTLVEITFPSQRVLAN